MSVNCQQKEMFSWNKFIGDTKLSLQLMKDAYERGELDEQAVPAYLNPNPLARWIFWKRIKACFDEILTISGETCLDFGCGSGIMLPILEQQFEKVFGVDLKPELSLQHIDRMKQKGWFQNGEVGIISSLENSNFPDNNFDVILAMDVLEHIENVDELLTLFRDKLKQTGVLLVTGPTENILYKMGRAITGYSGHYHIRNIYDIKNFMANYFDVQVVCKLVFPFTLFLVLKAVKK